MAKHKTECAAPPADSYHGLEMLNGPRAGERICMLRSQLEIGSSVPLGLSLPQAGIDKRHCLIRRKAGPAFILVSYQKGCGTKLNGTTIHYQDLHPGAEIVVGEQKLNFVSGVPWNPDEHRTDMDPTLGQATPRSLEQLRSALEPLSHRLRGLCMLTSAELALPSWRGWALGKKLEYVDSVVGMSHRVDELIPEQAVAFVKQQVQENRVRPCFTIDDAYAEPIVALQDDDLELPYAQEMTYYGIYNMFNVFTGLEFPDKLLSSAALAIHQTLVGSLYGQYKEPRQDQIQAAFDHWWQKCHRWSDKQDI